MFPQAHGMRTEPKALRKRTGSREIVRFAFRIQSSHDPDTVGIYTPILQGILRTVSLLRGVQGSVELAGELIDNFEGRDGDTFSVSHFDY